MYGMLRRYLIFLLLSVSLLLTLGMYEEGDLDPVGNLVLAPAPSDDPPAAASPGAAHFQPVSLEAKALAVLPAAEPAPQTGSAGEQPTLSLPVADEPALTEPEQGSEYITTAYFLNVRSAPTSKSEIIRVVEKDTILRVKGEAGNGWLQLTEDGYIHGAYAEPVKESVSGVAAENPVRMTKTMSEPEPASESEPVSPTSKVLSDSGLTAEHIEEILDGTELAGHQLEEAILEIEAQHGINAYFTIAVMKLESGNGESRLATRKNNLFGLNASGKNPYENAFRFETKADSVRKFGQLISEKYVDKGFTTVEKVARKYCPANARWPSLVKTIMKRDHNLL